MRLPVSPLPRGAAAHRDGRGRRLSTPPAPKVPAAYDPWRSALPRDLAEDGDMKRKFWGDKGAPGPERESVVVRIEDVMTKQVITVTRHQTVGHARGLFAEHGIHSVPVVDTDGSPAGILTTSDLVASVSDETRIGEVMTRELETVTPYADPSLAARLMLKHGIHHLIVTHEHKVVGILSSYDLLRLIEDRRFVAKNAPTPPRKANWEKQQDPGLPRSVEPLS